MDPNRMTVAKLGSALADTAVDTEQPGDSRDMHSAPRLSGWDVQDPAGLIISPREAIENSIDHPRVLIVDDLDINRRLMRAMLKTSNCEIVEAKRAGEAIAILEREKIDLVIVDQNEPSNQTHAHSDDHQRSRGRERGSRHLVGG
jgi:PleD family two-component response regulator